MPTIQSILPTIVPDKEITKINGQLGMVQSATMVISPALGAFLYAFIPINYLILMDVLGAVLSVGILAFIRIPSNLSNIVEKPRVIADAVFGFKRIASARGLWSMLIISSLFTLMFMPAASLYPLMTFQYFKGTVFQAGVVEMVWSIGSLVGGAIIGIFGNWKDRMRPSILAILVLGVAFALSGLLPASMTGFILFVVLNAFAGMAIAFPSTLPMAMIQQSFPPDELGRIFGVCMSLSGLAGPVGLLFVGPLADALGVEWIFVLSGIGSLLCGLLMFAVPSTRLYDRRLQQRLAQIPAEQQLIDE
jgi:DHA3 family macrolide efflux protein-like MFS transporter